MKSTNQVRVLIAILLLTFASTSYAQTEHVITLLVNTAEIKKPDIDVYCSFDGQDPNVAIIDYTTFVNNGDVIRWVGVSTSSEDDEVSITSINYHGGKNLLGINTLSGNDGEVVGTIRDGSANDEEKYTVSFKVWNNGKKRKGTFLIDPKIKVR
jgi:hypothetical protein